MWDVLYATCIHSSSFALRPFKKNQIHTNSIDFHFEDWLFVEYTMYLNVNNVDLTYSQIWAAAKFIAKISTWRI